jgi:hypothetical protein
MALTHHDDVELVAGDDWTIDGVLLDTNGSSLDLSGAFFEWTLIDPTGMSVAYLLGDTTISIIEPSTNGQVQILVPKQVTISLLAGRFHDALRVTSSATTTTFWVGTILVDCNPFGLIPPFIPGADLMSFDLVSGMAGFDTPTLVHS